MRIPWWLPLALLASLATGQQAGVAAKLMSAYQSVSAPLRYNPFWTLIEEEQPISRKQIQQNSQSFQRRLLQLKTGCGTGVQMLAFSAVQTNGLTGYSTSYRCYCPKDFGGNSCDKQLHPACIIEIKEVRQTSSEMSGTMGLNCIDYTGLMTEQGFKDDPVPGTNITSKVLWANDTAYYDESGHLLDNNAPHVNISFRYQPSTGPLYFTASKFGVATELISWSNDVESITICYQDISVDNINGLPFEFKCSVDTLRYQPYQPYGMMTLETAIYQDSPSGRNRISLKGYRYPANLFRWHLYNATYVQNGSWRVATPYPLWSKILAVVVVLTVLYLSWRQVKVWKRKSEISAIVNS